MSQTDKRVATEKKLNKEDNDEAHRELRRLFHH